MENKLPQWFVNRLNTVMKHNDYTNEMLTVSVCEAQGKWTPCDLIIREIYNNGGGSAKGFLGLTTSQAEEAFDFIRTNQKTLQEMDYYSEKGWNNFGFTLWTNYQLH